MEMISSHIHSTLNVHCNIFESTFCDWPVCPILSNIVLVVSKCLLLQSHEGCYNYIHISAFILLFVFSYILVLICCLIWSGIPRKVINRGYSGDTLLCTNLLE